MLTEKREDEIDKMYEGGLSICEIAKELNMNKGSLSRLFKNNKKLAQLKYEREENSVSKMIYENRMKIRGMINEGLSLREIAEILNCKRHVLDYWLYRKKLLYKD